MSKKKAFNRKTTRLLAKLSAIVLTLCLLVQMFPIAGFASDGDSAGASGTLGGFSANTGDGRQDAGNESPTSDGQAAGDSTAAGRDPSDAGESGAEPDDSGDQREGQSANPSDRPDNEQGLSRSKELESSFAGGMFHLRDDVDSEKDEDDDSEEDAEKEDDEENPEFTETVEIATEEELRALADRVNGGDRMAGVLMELTADLELGSEEAWTPIGNSHETPFSGTFRGNDHFISNIRTEENVQGGLFGHLYEATIENLYLKNVQAADSVGGLYFSAIRSTIADCEYKHGPFGIMGAGISLFSLSTASVWNGQWPPSVTTLSPSTATVYRITTAEQLATLSHEVNVGGNNFLGKTIILETDIDLNGSANWQPIGHAGTEFEGSFYGGNHTIYNMSSGSTGVGGLFGKVKNGAITNVIISDAVVNTSGDTGVLAAVSDSAISGVVVVNSIVEANEAAGIVFRQAHSGTMNMITQCAVIDADITANGGRAAGIVVDVDNYGVTQCAVYGGTLEANGEASGIVHAVSGPGGSYAVAAEHVVLGTEFSASSFDNAGITMDTQGWNTTSNCFISDIDIPEDDLFNPIGTLGEPNGVDSYFTDSRSLNHFVAEDNYTASCFWDVSTIAPGTVAIPTPMRENLTTLGKGHGAYTTSYLTSGAWVPNENYWVAEKDYYPYLKNLMTSQTPGIAEIMSLASVAVLLDDPNDTLSDAKAMRLPGSTVNGESISWSTYNASVQPRMRREGSETIYYTDENIGSVTFSLLAEITIAINGETRTLSKKFEGLGLTDSVLEEDVGLRYPPTGSEIAVDDTPRLTFIDHVVISPNPRGMIRLDAQRRDGTFTTEQVLACDGSLDGVDNIEITTNSAGKYEVKFHNLYFQYGTTYRLIIPAGVLDESDGGSGTKTNLNETIVIEFSTESRNAPIITAPEYRKQFATNTPLTTDDLLDWFTVGSSDTNLTDMHGPGNHTAQPLSTAVTDPVKTLESLLPLGAGVYYSVDPDIIGASHQRGVSTMHIFAVSSTGMGARRSITIEVDALPDWKPEPAEILHTYLTDSQATIKELVRNSGSATYASARGSERLAVMDSEVDAADWALAQANPQEPAVVKVTSYLYDSLGNRMDASAKETIVYMDKVLEYTFNTGALYYFWDEDRTLDEWKELIEEDIAFYALNFADTANVTFDHEHNTYSESKVYTVYLETATQHVTMCDTSLPCTANIHGKIKDKVKLKFYIKIVNAHDPDERAFWEKIRNELLESIEFNDAVVRRPRLSSVDKLEGEEFTDNYFDMPADIIEALRLQPYNTLDLHYSAYRWKFYGHALEELPEKQRIYPLKVTLESEKDLYHVKKSLGQKEPVVGVKFEYIGKLNGEIEFLYDLRLAGGLSRAEIESTDFYLYKYMKATPYASAKLVPVSDVIVDADGWASAVLTELDNATYVFADDRFGGRTYSRYIGYGAGTHDDDDDEPSDIYYKSARQAGDLAMFEADPPEEGFAFDLDGEIPDKTVTETISVDANLTPDAGDDATGGFPMPIVTVAGAIIVILGGVAVFTFKSRKGKGA